MLKQLRHLLRSEQGNFAIIFGLAITPVMGLVGAAVDYTIAAGVRTELQAAVDAGAHAAAPLPTDQRDSIARKFFYRDFTSKFVSAPPTVTVANGTDNSVTVSAQAQVATSMMKVMGISHVEVGATASAVTAGTGVPVCILALNPTDARALNWTGGSTIRAKPCAIEVDSNSGTAVSLTGGSSIVSADNCFVGGVSTTGGSYVDPAPRTSCQALGDPFRTYPQLTYGACDYKNYKANSGSVTLSPGVYCGGITLSGGVNATFKPGIYVVKDGQLTPSGGANLTGDGVAFYLTGSDAGVDLGGGGDYHLTAPLTGSLAGFLFFLDRYATPARQSTLSGNGTIYYEGVLYFPTQPVQFGGTTTSTTPSPFTAYIADSFKYNGTSDLLIDYDAAKTKVPVPPGIIKSSGKSRLTH